MQRNCDGRTLNRKRGQSGFTLIELLAALAITAIIAGAGAAVLRMLATSREELDTQSELDQNADAAMSAVESALRNAYRPRIAADLVFEGVDGYDGGLPRDSVRFFTISTRQIRGDEPESDVKEVEFFLAQPDPARFPILVRRTDPTRNDEPDRGGVVERVAGGVMGMNLSYFDGTAWLEEWPASRRDYPAAVRVELIVARGTAAKPTFTTAARVVTFPRRARTRAEQAAARTGAPAGGAGNADQPGRGGTSPQGGAR